MGPIGNERPPKHTYANHLAIVQGDPSRSDIVQCLLLATLLEKGSGVGGTFTPSRAT